MFRYTQYQRKAESAKGEVYSSNILSPLPFTPNPATTKGVAQ